jgi:hypothetical protein
MFFLIIEIILIWNKISKFRLIKTYKGINLKMKEKKKLRKLFYSFFFFFCEEEGVFIFFFKDIY